MEDGGSLRGFPAWSVRLSRLRRFGPSILPLQHKDARFKIKVTPVTALLRPGHLGSSKGMKQLRPRKREAGVVGVVGKTLKKRERGTRPSKQGLQNKALTIFFSSQNKAFKAFKSSRGSDRNGQAKSRKSLWEQPTLRGAAAGRLEG